MSDLRIRKLISWRPKNLHYYHLVFTIPEELRPFFLRHRNALKFLSKTASQSTLYYFQVKHKITPWILSVIHTFGAKLNRNAHIHLIVSCGGISKNNSFKHISFIPYKLLLVSRKKYLIKNLKIWCTNNLHWNCLVSEKKLLNFLYSQKKMDSNEEKSRYIYFSKKANNFETVLSYIGRYLKRPVIAQSRIIHYDWKNVTYSYVDKYDGEVKYITVPALDFLKTLIQHIPNKFFKMVQYSGIFANRSKRKYLKIIGIYYHNYNKLPKIPNTFRERIILFTGVDPLKCKCWWYFRKFQIFIPWYAPKYFDSS